MEVIKLNGIFYLEEFILHHLITDHIFQDFFKSLLKLFIEIDINIKCSFHAIE